MPEYRNTTNQTVTIPAKGEAKDGHAPTDSLAPGEVKNVNPDTESQTFKALVEFGALAEEKAQRKAPAAKE